MDFNEFWDLVEKDYSLLDVLVWREISSDQLKADRALLGFLLARSRIEQGINRFSLHPWSDLDQTKGPTEQQIIIDHQSGRHRSCLMTDVVLFYDDEANGRFHQPYELKADETIEQVLARFITSGKSIDKVVIRSVTENDEIENKSIILHEILVSRPVRNPETYDIYLLKNPDLSG